MSDITAAAALSGKGALDPKIETQAAYALIVSKYVMWTASATSILTAILWLPFRQHVQLLVNAGALVLVAVGAGLYPSFHRRGRIRAGIIIAGPENAYHQSERANQDTTARVEAESR